METLVYLFKFIMSNIKSEEVAQGCSKRKVFLGIPQNSLENSSAGVFFIIKLQAESIKPNFHVHILSGTGIFL